MYKISFFFGEWENLVFYFQYLLTFKRSTIVRLSKQPNLQFPCELTIRIETEWVTDRVKIGICVNDNDNISSSFGQQGFFLDFFSMFRSTLQ